MELDGPRHTRVSLVVRKYKVADVGGRIKSQMEVSFARYVGEVLNRRGSVGHYATAVRTASRYLREKSLIDGELFEIESLEKLKGLRDVLYADGSFIEQNLIGNNMYSVGLNHFVDFLGLETITDGAGETLIERKNTVEHRVLTYEDIEKLDAPVEIPEKEPKVVYGWNRDRVVVEQVLKADKRKCEIDPEHRTFVTRRNDEPYLEGHHLIQLSWQKEFGKSLDVYANIIGVCPNCHRQLHFGRRDEIRRILKPIYDLRAERLHRSGIDISKDEFLAIAVE